MTGANPVAGLILAAGLSKRFGSNKLIEPLAGEPLIRKTVRPWLMSKIARLYVVIGHQGEDIAETLEGLPLEIVENPDFGAGLASSVAAGLQEVQHQYGRVLIGLGDMPYIKPETIDELIGAASSGRAETQVWIPCFEGKRGNPILWERSAYPDLAALKGDQGGRQLFQDYANVTVEVPVSDSGILRDIDVRQDLDP